MKTESLVHHLSCAWPNCQESAICLSENFNNLPLCLTHFEFTNSAVKVADINRGLINILRTDVRDTISYTYISEGTNSSIPESLREYLPGGLDKVYAAARGGRTTAEIINSTGFPESAVTGLLSILVQEGHLKRLFLEKSSYAAVWVCTCDKGKEMFFQIAQISKEDQNVR